jgi:hypothetical protein
LQRSCRIGERRLYRTPVPRSHECEARRFSAEANDLIPRICPRVVTEEPCAKLNSSDITLTRSRTEIMPRRSRARARETAPRGNGDVTGTVKSFNATKGVDFIQPTDGGTDVSFTSALSSAAGCVTSTKAGRSPMMLSRTSAPASRQLPISNQRDEEFAYPVGPPFN